MTATTRITMTLPADLVAKLRMLTDDISGYVAEAVARQIRHQLLGEDLRRYQEEHGAFADEEIAGARERILGTGSADDTSAAALLEAAGLRGHAHVVDATVAEVALRQSCARPGSPA